MNTRNTIRSLITAPTRLNNLNRALGWMLSGYLLIAFPVQTNANDIHFALVGQAPLPPALTSVRLGSFRIQGNYAFCTLVDPDSGSGGFMAIDVEDPANPKNGEYLWFAAGPGDLAIAGNFAFLVQTCTFDGDQPFSVVDISDPLKPTLKKSQNNNQTTPGGRIEISGQRAFLSGGRTTLGIWNIADPVAPTRIARYDTSTWRYGLPSSPDFSFVADSDESWIIEDVSDPSNPRVLGGYKSIARVLGVTVFRDQAYAVGESTSSRDDKLDIVDISVPSAPKILGSYDVPDDLESIVALTYSQGYVYISSGGSSGGTWQAVDVSDPANPQRAGFQRFSGGPFYGPGEAVVQGDLAYVADGINGLIILRIYTDLRIGPAIVLDDGRLQLQLRGASGQRVRVQRSTNLRDWEDWQTVTLGATGSELFDQTAAAPQRFYRAVKD